MCIKLANSGKLCKGDLGGVPPFLDYYVITDELFNPFTYITMDNLSYIVLHTHQNTHWSCSV